MRRGRLPIVLAILVIVTSILACSSFAKMSLTNPRMAFDEKGIQPTTIYSPSDKFYAVADLNNARKGTVVTTKWYAVEVEGYETGYIDATVLIVDQEFFTGYVSFQYAYQDTNGWPEGEYKAEMYLNDELAYTLTFAVK